MSFKDELTKIIGVEKLEAVKAFLKFSVEPQPVKVEVKLEDVTLQDGTVLTVDKKEVGANATITTAEGSNPAPDGEYIDTDGNTYTIMGGVISEIKPKVEEPAEPVIPVEASATTDTSAQIAELKNILAKMEKTSNEKFAKLVSDNKSLNDQLTKNKEGVTLALSVIEGISKTPVASSLELKAFSKSDSTNIPYENMTKYQQLLFNKGKL